MIIEHCRLFQRQQNNIGTFDKQIRNFVPASITTNLWADFIIWSWYIWISCSFCSSTSLSLSRFFPGSLSLVRCVYVLLIYTQPASFNLNLSDIDMYSIKQSTFHRTAQFSLSINTIIKCYIKCMWRAKMTKHGEEMNKQANNHIHIPLHEFLSVVAVAGMCNLCVCVCVSHVC